MQITLKAPAKINIGLIVKDKRTDGYHNIETIMVPVKLYDTITIKKNKTGIHLKTDTRQLASIKDNLVYKTAELFFNDTKISGGAEIILQKTIPIGAGLGGGSSDAAYTLLGINRLYNNTLSFSQLKRLAIKIGMDVAFFLYQSACWATGRGEILKPIRVPRLIIALYLPKFSISTQWAYQQLGVGLTDRDFSLKLLSNKLINNELIGVNALAVNTFERVVFKFYPDLLDAKCNFIANGAYFASLSGTGSAVYGIFDKETFKTKRYLFNKTILFTESISEK